VRRHSAAEERFPRAKVFQEKLRGFRSVVSTREEKYVPELQVIARYVVSEGKVDDVLALLRQLQAAARTEPGNVAFDVYRQLDDERGVVLLERYASREAFEAHRETDHFKAIVLEQIVPLLDSRTFDLLDVAP
jgi:quinol monooxygenase YgiN